MVLETILNMDYWLLIVILSLIVTLISTLTYKYTTDQKKIKQHRADVKKLQKEMKLYKDDQKKMLKTQQEMMSKNMDLMKQSFKPMLYTFIPLLLILSWMSSTLAFEPIQPGVPFAITATFDENYMGTLNETKLTADKAIKMKLDNDFQPDGKQLRWIINAEEEGTYNFLIEGESFKETKEVLVTNSKKYVSPTQTYSGQLEKIEISNKKVKPFQGLPIIGGLDWLWSYILLSVVMSIGLRKLLKIA
ncbi:EMC3/TMCO1 family protein [Candidatus Woesearchaeota archaeon]|nr:EMC3/TMCO1 family protein [Candidatus Woesearchaeota archaeon]